LFFFGQGVSLIGTWMQTIALGWLVYRITHSPFLLGMVGFAGQLPMLLLTPLAGVLSDRWHRRRVLVVTQSLAMLQALTLACLTLTGLIQIWHLMALAVFSGAINSFDMPTRQAFTLEMVDRKEDLANAIALNSSVFNASRLIGPTVAGILISLVGEGTCFLLNGLSYIAVIVALLSMRLAPPQAQASGKTCRWACATRLGSCPSAIFCCCWRWSAWSACPIRY
jgi:MFS family permease